MSQQIVMAALLKPCLRHPLIVEETDNIGEQRSLGIDPLGVSLQIEPTDAECSDPVRRLRIQSLGKLDTRATVTKFSAQAFSRSTQRC